MRIGKTLIFVLVLILLIGVIRNRNSDELTVGSDTGSINVVEEFELPEGVSNYTPGKLGVINIIHENSNRFAYVYIPKSLETPVGASSLYVFHGGGGGGADIILERIENVMIALAEEKGIVFVIPSSEEGKQWSDGRPETEGVDDVGFIMELKSELEKKYGLSSEKAFATGVSNGGLLAQFFACTEPDVFAGYAPVVANLVVEVEPICQDSLAKPMMFMHGTEDVYMPYNGGEIKKSDLLGKGAGGTVLSADETISFWSNKLGCGETPSVSQFDNNPDDGTSVSHHVWGGCAKGSAFERYVLEGGGHTVFGTKQNKMADRLVGLSGDEINSVEAAVSFFEKFGL